MFRFDVKDDRRYWLLLQRPAPEICFKPPGYDEDLVLVTTSEWLTKWHVGRLSLGDALHAGRDGAAGRRCTSSGCSPRWAAGAR